MYTSFIVMITVIKKEYNYSYYLSFNIDFSSEFQ